MKILITGAKGMLGSELTSLLGQKYELYPVDKEEMDITDECSCEEIFRRIKPDVVINCAAFTNVDLCETEKDLAWKINAWGSRNLALLSEKYGCRLISISTDYVFNGSKDRPYHEFDLADGGETVYGQTKRAGELLIQENCKNYLIVRISWLYGKNGKNFVDTMLSLAKKGLSELKVVNDQIGNPTSTRSVAWALDQLLSRPDYIGTVHATCEGAATWYEFALEIFRLKGINQKVLPCSTEEFPRPAKRPKNSRLEKRVLRLMKLPSMPDWKDELKNYLSNPDE